MNPLAEFLNDAIRNMPRIEDTDSLILDSSKIRSYMDCPRKFFYEHVLGWRREQYRGDIHLIFGRAYHAAKEYLWLNGFSPESVHQAMKLFVSIYVEATPDQQEAAKHKNPVNAYAALQQYVKEFADDHGKYPVIATEFGGSMPIVEGFVITFRMDSIHRNSSNQILFMDDKTAGRTEKNAYIKYNMSFQMGTYHQALRHLFPNDEIWGGMVTETVFLSKTIEFNRYPVRLTRDHMDNWLGMAAYYSGSIQTELEQLTDCSDSDSYLRAFPQNTESCTKYYGCPFADFCTAWANPLKRATEVPMGFKLEHWNPLAHMKEEGVNVIEMPKEVAFDGHNIQ